MSGDFATARGIVPAGTGTVLATATAAKSGSTVTASVNGTTVTVQVARDLSVSSGDVIIVTRVGSQWFALGRAYSAAPAGQFNDAGPVPAPPVTTGVLTVAPVETRSYRGSSWRTDTTAVYQGRWQNSSYGNHTGCAFYGNGPRSLAGATVTGAGIQVRRLDGGWYAAQTTTMRLVTEAFRPSGAPTLGASTAGPSLAVGGQAGFGVPTSWVQAMVDGTAGGLGFFEADSDPYVVLAGRGDWGPAFTLTINWQRG